MCVMSDFLSRVEESIPSIGWKNIIILFLQSLAGNFLFSILLLYSLKWTSAAAGGIIIATVPAVIGLISFLFLRERLTWDKGIGMVITTVGIGVISSGGKLPVIGQGTNSLYGNLLIFGAVIGEAL